MTFMLELLADILFPYMEFHEISLKESSPNNEITVLP
jgi:hypothetical protein